MGWEGTISPLQKTGGVCRPVVEIRVLTVSSLYVYYNLVVLARGGWALRRWCPGVAGWHNGLLLWPCGHSELNKMAAAGPLPLSILTLTLMTRFIVGI